MPAIQVRGVGELAAELIEIDAVLGDFAVAEKNHRDIVGELRAQGGVGVNVDFAQSGVELCEQRGDLLLGFVAEVAAGASVEGEDKGRRCIGGHRAA
jgi:hypothetical protein